MVFVKVRNAVNSSARMGIRSDTHLCGSNLGPFVPQNHPERRYNTQNKPKRYNSLEHRAQTRQKT
jgi:hypothetical protein